MASQQRIKNSKTYRSFVVFWAIYSVLIAFIFGAYFLLAGNYKIILIALAALIFARLIVSPLIYVLYKKARPYQRFNFQPISSRLFSAITKRYNAFPSDHALSFAVVATVFYGASPLIGGLLFVFGVLNSWARVSLGNHDFWDVLGGWILGILSGILALYGFGRFW